MGEYAVRAIPQVTYLYQAQPCQELKARRRCRECYVSYTVRICPAYHLPALGFLPPELFELIIDDLDEAALAALSRTCRVFHSQCEAHRYKRAQGHSLASLGSLEAGLASGVRDRCGRRRDERLEGLSIDWEGSVDGLPLAFPTMANIFGRSSNLQEVEIRTRRPPSHSWSAAWYREPPTLCLKTCNARSLTVTGHVVRCLRNPAPTLTCMTLDVPDSEFGAYIAVSNAFASVLRRLRIIRRLSKTSKRQSPVRVCERLHLRSLKYLEVCDRADTVSLYPAHNANQMLMTV